MDNRARLWSLLVWSDTREDYADVLDELQIPWIESPWHDKDKNNDGTDKKPHKHIILAFSGKKSYEQIKAITDELGTTIPQRVNDLRSSVRYLIHEDNENKFHYDIRDIKAHCGFTDPSKFFEMSKQLKIDTTAEIMRFIEEKSIMEFTVFENYCRECHYYDWYPVLFDGGIKYLIEMKIRSQRNYVKNL